MKKITIVCLLAISILAACHKPDLPCKKQCQIKSIEGVYRPNPITITDRVTKFVYNKQRLLDSLSVRPITGTQPPLIVRVTYNNQGKPVYWGFKGVYWVFYNFCQQLQV